jgi:transposase InsO family protein
MVGKLHKSWPGGHVYILVAVDKFTKWVEAALVTTQDSTTAINFIKSIVFRFGVPHSIITNNGTNFISIEFKSYCESMGIKLKFMSVAHPKTNGQVEKANGLICNEIKKRLLAPLEKAKHAWVDELSSVLWSLRTTPNVSTQETPFFWSMAQNPCFQSKSLMKPQESRLMMKKLLQKHFRMTLMHLMKKEMSH